MKQWIDEHTGRKIRQLTDSPGGVSLDYFRLPRYLPNGLVMASGSDDPGDLWLLDAGSGDCQRRRLPIKRRLKLRERDGKLWYVGTAGRDVWEVTLPEGVPHRVTEVPAEITGHIVDITCDGESLIIDLTEELGTARTVPLTKDAGAFWRYIDRPRKGYLWSYDVANGTVTELARSQIYGFGHHDTSPADGHLVKFSPDYYDALCQRIWTARTDGSQLTRIRPQKAGEFVTHEFWWPDGKAIGYTYQDRRQDPALRELPWGEYAPVPSHFGVANLKGEEIYLSDPLNHYHSHLYVSADTKWSIGDGTEGHSFVYAAAFSLSSSRIEFQALATVHTPYVPFAGQGVDATITPDGRWMLYNDTLDGVKQVCAVALE
ncbi:MAG: hypothetical protein IT209_08750 [Armatimonadetes bacterium]|nr:hypothetical protein [Armatimonadota bacterium]